MHRQEKDKVRTAKKRASSMPIEYAISNLHSNVKLGPDSVCIIIMLPSTNVQG